MRRVALLVVLLFASRADAADTWTYASSEHFEVYTTAGAGTARQSLAYFERIHTFFAHQLGLNPDQKALTRLIIFSNDRQFAPYRPNANAAAFYQSGVDRDYIVMRRFDEESDAIVAHEYMHLVIRYANAQFPVWFNEGLAEFFSTVSPEGGKMTIGKVPEARLLYLRSGVSLIDIRRLFAVRQDSPEYNTRTHAGVFYSESWALTHMLEIDPRYRNGMKTFLNAMAGGMNSADALMTAFGKTPEAVFGDLVNYIQQSQYLYGTTPYQMPPDVKYETRIADQFEADLVTTNLLANSPTGQDAARAAFEKLEQQKPNDVATLESRAYFELYRGHRDDAMPYFDRAVTQGSRNVKLMMDYARLDPAKAGALVTKAMAIAPGDPDVRIAHARQLLRDGKPADAVLALQGAQNFDRQQWFDVYQVAANAYRQLNQIADAREAAKRMAQYAEQGAQAEFAIRMMKSIDDYEAQRAAVEQRSRANAAAAADGRLVAGGAASPSASSRTTSAAPFGGGTLVAVAGRIRNIACDKGETILEVLVGNQTLRLFIDDGKSVIVLGQPGAQAQAGTVDLKCGAQDQKVTVGYAPGADAARKTVGFVRMLDYR
jgi:hypothetical protein